MDEREKKSREAELDRFWDVDSLLPKKRAVHYTADTETVDVVIEPMPTNTGVEATVPRTVAIPKAADTAKPRFIPPHTAEEFSNVPLPDEEYTPNNALIHKVRIYRWKSDYRYYEGFVRDAVRLYAIKGVECPRVSFFSYVPQYSQMSRPQLEWYLWWRENVRNGVYPDTDYSYILLYVYELINLSERMDAHAAQDALCRIWVSYRDTYRKLDSYLPEWICDFSLIHRLTPPKECTGKLLGEVMQHCTLKEFYVPADGGDIYVRALLAFCSNYDYRKSKFYGDERKAVFDAAVPGALRALVEKTSENGRLFSSAGMEDNRLVRDSYNGAICSYRIKRRIEVEFCSFSRSHELRYFITDVVKHVENRVRAALGIRSRLSVYALSTPMRNILDEYLDRTLPKRVHEDKRSKQATEPQPYESLYDLPQKKLSLSDAAEIERLSWETTERLVEAFGEEPLELVPEPKVPTVPLPSLEPTPPVQAQASEGGTEAAWQNAVQPYLGFLRAVWNEDGVGQRATARELGLPCEVVADRINELAAEHTGDILLEEAEVGFTVIEDYRSMLEELIGQSSS